MRGPRRPAGERDTSLTYNRSTKLRFHADAGISDHWVVDSDAEPIEVYPTPAPERDRDVTRLAGAATLGPLSFPDLELTTAEVLA
jgi:Uma2 family endonuclease